MGCKILRAVTTLFAVVLCARAESYRDRWLSVADKLVQTPVESYPFNWGEGVQFIGVMKVYERTKDARYADYAEKWTDQFLRRDINELLNTGDKARGKRPGYCGHWSPGSAILYLYQARKKPEHLQLAEQVASFIRNGAERSPEGGLGHWTGSHQLWVDTLYMACPLLAGLGKLKRRPELIDDAAQQILIYARHLQDDKTGLFYHMWDWQTSERSPSLWGRGNGWVLMSMADTMEALDRRRKSYADLKRIAERMAAGLHPAQDGEGMWHTVLDDPASYPESSATSMFCYSLLKLIRLKVLDGTAHLDMALKAWKAVNERYVKDGTVTGVSAGTGPGGSEQYKKIPLGTQTWGTGSYLMAGSEINRLR
jgi:unsaturated rhamnogalacturonyl hydrolase